MRVQLIIEADLEMDDELDLEDFADEFDYDVLLDRNDVRVGHTELVSVTEVDE